MKINPDDMNNPYSLIWHERVKQDAKWGGQNHDNLRWLAILMEEVGECAENVVEDTPTKERLYSTEALRENLIYELTQVAAVCVAWLECMKRKTGNLSGGKV